jgi:hypothetical protein
VVTGYIGLVVYVDEALQNDHFKHLKKRFYEHDFLNLSFYTMFLYAMMLEHTRHSRML